MSQGAKQEAALSLGPGETASHPRAVARHLGLCFMAARGALPASPVP